MTQAELGRRAGLDKHAVHRVVSGRGVTFDQVWAIAGGLEVSPIELLPLDERAPVYSADEVALIDAARSGNVGRVVAALSRLGVELPARANPAPEVPTSVLREVGSAAAEAARTGVEAARAQQQLADAINRAVEEP